jgi:hypothetical protein
LSGLAFDPVEVVVAVLLEVVVVPPEVVVVPPEEVVVPPEEVVVPPEEVVVPEVVVPHARVWTGYQIASARIDLLPALSSATSASE